MTVIRPLYNSKLQEETAILIKYCSSGQSFYTLSYKLFLFLSVQLQSYTEKELALHMRRHLKEEEEEPQNQKPRAYGAH